MLISIFVGLNACGVMSGHVSHQNITVISITSKLIIFLMFPLEVRVILFRVENKDVASPCKIGQFQQD